MAQGRWKLTSDSIAIEAFIVLIERKKASLTYSKADLIRLLANESVYMDFLKICAEYDDTDTLVHFRKGLLFVIQGIGIGKVAEKANISRMSLYRMLSKEGNPRFDTLMRLFRLLGVRLWVVDQEYVSHREQLVRPRDQRFVKGYRAKIELGSKQDAAFTMSQVESKNVDIDDEETDTWEDGEETL